MRVKRKKSTLSYLYLLILSLAPRRKKQIISLIILLCVGGSLELLMLGVMFPFLELLERQDTDLSIKASRIICQSFDKCTYPQQLSFIAILFVAIVVTGTFLRVTNLFLIGQVSASCGSDISHKTFKNLLLIDYELQLSIDHSLVLTALSSGITRFIELVSSLFQFTSAASASLLIVLYMLYIEPTVLISASIALLALYLIYFKATSLKLSKNSAVILNSNANELQSIQDALLLSREIRMTKSVNFYANKYNRSSVNHRSTVAVNRFIGAAPRYLFEGLAIAMVGIWGYLLSTDISKPASILPLLGTFALGSQRLLPSLQQAYGCLAALKGYEEDLKNLYSFTSKISVPQIISKVSANTGSGSTSDYLQLKQISYKYPSGSSYILNDLSITIEENSCTAIVGRSGCGKTTLAEIMAGLLKPSLGQVYFRGKDIWHNPDSLDHWQSQVSYVTQNPHIASGSILQNIALGLPPSKIDKERLLFAAEKAHLMDHINSLNDGFDAYVGRGGMQLSGGQKQRIGIARAIYSLSSFVILDEPTSSQDNQTQLSLINTIENIRRTATVIIIAHRYRTIEACDNLITLS